VSFVPRCPLAHCESSARGVGHLEYTARANWSVRSRVEPSGLMPVVAIPGVSFQSRLDGVGHIV
jgi:hypothetical protein